MKSCLLIVIALLIATPTAANEVETAIRAKCKADWPTDYSMQNFCVTRQTEAARKLERHRERWPEGSEERKILERCVTEWAGADGSKADYSLVNLCFDQQLEAYRSLQQ